MAYVGATTIAASGSTTFSPGNQDSMAGLESSTYHTISITGTGTATIAFQHADQSSFIDFATGISGDVDTYVCRGATAIRVTETGGANSIDVAISSYEE